jgi:hypothetical protein
VPPSQQVPDTAPSSPTHRLLLRDVITLLLFLGWCALGIMKVGHDVAEYRAQQSAIAAFEAQHAGQAYEVMREASGAQPVAVPYNPSLGTWLIGEVLGYLVTIAVVAAGRYRARDRTIKLQVKWIAPIPRPAVSAAATPFRREPPHRANPGNVAAERLSVIVWSDQVARREKERA